MGGGGESGDNVTMISILMGVSATGSHWEQIVGFLGTGIIVAVLRHDGATASISEVLKMSVRTPVSWSGHS